MSVVDGQKANAAIFNAAFVSKTADSSMTGVLDLNSATSGSQVEDVQQAVNDIFDAVGISGIGDTASKTYSSQLIVADGDDRKVAIGKLDAQVAASMAAIALAVAGPTSATDNAIARFDATTGRLLQNSGVIVDDSNNVTGVNDLTVTGTLTVNGTTTSVNSTNLEVTDKNITVNKGGNDAASEGAGVTVDRTSTKGSFIYATAAATKFKIGALAAEVEVADISTAQTFTNKTISGLANTITNVSLTAGVTGTLPVANGGTNLTGFTAGDIAYCSATNVLSKLPIGSNDKVLTVVSGLPAWQTAAGASGFTGPLSVSNLGLSVSVAANAMTIALKQSDGTTNPASGTGAVTFSFRDPTSATGAYSSVSVTAALSIVIPSGASLGHRAAMPQYVWVYAINNAGTVDLAVSGVTPFDDSAPQSSTTISSGATLGTTMYANTGVSTKAVRLIGRLLVSEATAGTWASNTTEIALMPIPKYCRTPRVAYTPTSAGFGTLSAALVHSYRDGEWLVTTGIIGTGTVNASAAQLEYGYNGSTFSTLGYSANNVWGSGTNMACGTYANTNAQGQGPILFLTGNLLAFGFGTSVSVAAAPTTNAAGNTLAGSSGAVTFTLRTPIAGWSDYGPP